MSRIRKTANIAAILKRTNYRLLHSTCSPDVRRGMATVLESILMDAGLYSGFGYLTKSDLEAVGLRNEKPGVAYTSKSTGSEVEPNAYFDELVSEPEAGANRRYAQSFPDESRRHYYVHRAIHGDYRELERDGEIPRS